MRVLHAYNGHRGRGGADVAVATTVRVSLAGGLDVRTFVRDSRDLAPGVRGRLAAFTNGVYARRSVADFESALAEFRPDIVHVHELYPLISPWILPRCTARGVPVVMSVSDYRFTCPITTHFRAGRVCMECVGGHEARVVLHNCRENFPESIAYALFAKVRTWFRLYSDNVAHYVAPSDFLGRWLVEHVPIAPERVTTVYPPVPLPAEAADPAAGRYVAFAGRFAAGKGVDVLLEAVRRVKLPLRLSGDRDSIEGVRPGEDIALVPAHGRDEVDAFLRGARVVVMPSIWNETFGLVAAEAMALGLPVVASRIGALVENVRDGETGLLVAPGDPIALADAISRLWNDPELCRRLGNAGRARVRDLFRDELHFEGLRAVYERVLAAH